MKALPLFRLLLSLLVTVAAGSSIGGDGSEMEDGTHLRGGIPDHDEGKDIPLGHHWHFERYLGGLAEKLNIGLNETREFLLQRQDFVEHTRHLYEDANFVGAKLADAPDGEFIIRYKNGDVPQKSWEGVDKFKKKHGDAVVSLVSTRLSLKDAHERARRLSDILKKKAYTSVGYEIYGDDIHVTAQPPQGQGQVQGMRLLARADAASIMTLDDDHDDLIGLSLHLVGHDQESPDRRLALADPDDAEYYEAGVGGTIIQENDPDFPGHQRKCTTGFAVTHKKTGTTGLLTAGHCAFHMKYRKKKKGNKKWVPLKWENGEESETNGDHAWYSRQRGHGTSLHMRPYFFVKEKNPHTGNRDWALFPVWGSARYHIELGSHVFCYSRNHEKIREYEVEGFDGRYEKEKDDWIGDLIRLGGSKKHLEPGDSGGPCWAYTNNVHGLHVLAVGVISGGDIYENKSYRNKWYVSKLWNAERRMGVKLMDTNLKCSQTEHPCTIPDGDIFV